MYRLVFRPLVRPCPLPFRLGRVLVVARAFIRRAILLLRVSVGRLSCQLLFSLVPTSRCSMGNTLLRLAPNSHLLIARQGSKQRPGAPCVWPPCPLSQAAKLCLSALSGFALLTFPYLEPRFFSSPSFFASLNSSEPLLAWSHTPLSLPSPWGVSRPGCSASTIRRHLYHRSS